MQKVTDYTLVSEITTEALEESVKQKMASGWVPSGTAVAFKSFLVQAMVKFEAA